MANNMDEFEREEFGPGETASPADESMKKRLADAWRTQPLFKLMVIMVVVGVALAGALGVFSGPPTPEASHLIKAPDLKEPPGGKSSSYFIEQAKMANAERADQAIQQGSSAMPTPVGQNFDITDLTDKKKEDPLAEFRAETERLKKEIDQERQQNAQQIQMIQQQTQQRPTSREDNELVGLMRKQMEQLMEAWSPRKMTVVEGAGAKEEKQEKKQDVVQASLATGAAAASNVTSSTSQKVDSKTLIQAGTVNYGQLLTEANSDIKGPIMAQIVSGPMAGGRALGQFKVMYDYLVLEFSLVNFKGKDYPVQILALDPNTTLGGMATEVDHRYFDRILLPAAASFASQFGQTLGQGKSNVSITDSAVVVDNASRSYKEALFSGLGEAGRSISQFLQQEASQIKPLVRVAVGTPLGLFFLRSVKEEPEQNMTSPLYPYGNPNGVAGAGYSMIPGYAGTTESTSQTVGYPYGTATMGGAQGTMPSYSQTGIMPGTGLNQSYTTQGTALSGSGLTILTPNNQTGFGSSVYYSR